MICRQKIVVGLSPWLSRLLSYESPHLKPSDAPEVIVFFKNESQIQYVDKNDKILFNYFGHTVGILLPTDLYCFILTSDRS